MTAALLETNCLFDADTHAYLQGGKRVPSVTQLLSKYGLTDDFNHVDPRTLAFAAARGNAVHEAARLLVADQLDESSVDPRIAGYVDAVRAFLRDTRVQVIDVETPRISPLGFGFRVDLIAWFNGVRSVFDYKTAAAMPKSGGPQTAAYLIGWNSLFSEQPVEERFGVHLRADGTYRLKQYEDPEDVYTFLHCLEAEQKGEHNAE